MGEEVMCHIDTAAFNDELAKIALDSAKDSKKKGLLRRVGPAAGALVGGALGFARGLRRPGQLLKSTVTGLGTGATLGWMPDVMATGVEAIRDRVRGQ